MTTPIPRPPRPDVAAPIEVTLYRKENCGLCDQAAAALVRISIRMALRVTHIDIDSDPGLQARYFLEVPVVAVDGEEIARAPIRERTLEAALRELG